MSERVRLTPLTLEEQTFAGENHSILEQCMRVQHINNELYDVAAMGYLMAVKKWFARPELHKWSFQTIVKQSVRSYVGAERKKQERRIQTVSFDAVIPGTDDLTYGSSVTEDNIRYLTGGKEEMSVQMSYGVKIPESAKAGRTPSVEIEKLLEFLDSKYKTMCFTYSDKKEANSKSSTLRSWKKTKKRTDFNVYKMAERIFIEKVPVKGRRKGNVNEN